MTKERKLAIEMWRGIRDMLSAFDSFTGLSIQEYKREFCREHGLEWEYNCWFCEYMHDDCIGCPLGNCRAHSDYDNVVDDRVKKDVRVEACNNIIKALGGEV